jgi:toxin YoeB
VTDLRFHPEGWDDYLYWQSQDKRTLRRINALIQAALREPRDGIGQPEALRGDLAGAWSRRIDKENRIVYLIEDDAIVIISCRGHYSDH